MISPFSASSWLQKLYRKGISIHKKFYEIFNPRIIIFFLDVGCVILSLFLVFWLQRIPVIFCFWKLSLGYACIAAIIIYFIKSYRIMWRYFSLRDGILFFKAIGILDFMCLPLFFLYIPSFSISFFILHIGILMALWSGSRLIYRYLFEKIIFWKKNILLYDVLIIGTGKNAELFIRENLTSYKGKFCVEGMISTCVGNEKSNIHGIEVLGNFSQCEKIIEKLSAKGVKLYSLILAEEMLSGKNIHDLMRIARRFELPVERLFPMASGDKDQFQRRAIALEDLIGRSAITLNMQSVYPWITGKRILITGAGGSIGLELTKQILNFFPKEVLLLDHNEYALYKAEREIAEKFNNICYQGFLLDVRDKARLKEVIEKERPDIVFHAAALKHVPMVEKHVIQGVETNLLSTAYLAEICCECDVSTMVLISTDKAVYPESVMGMTKRFGELYCQALDKNFPKTKTRFLSVRFGNVLESAGSVIPLFRRQLQRGGPLTVTHPSVKRYFMTLHEAVSLILQAGVLGSGSHFKSGSIFILDMGEKVSILTLAENLIYLSGFKPYEEISIKFTGLRPGEKFSECLWEEGENIKETSQQGVFYTTICSYSYEFLKQTLTEIEQLVTQNKKEETIAVLKNVVCKKLEIKEKASM